MITEKDLFTGLQFQSRNGDTIYTLNLDVFDNVTWKSYMNGKESIDGTNYSLKEICDFINNDILIIINKNKMYELW